MSDCKVNKPLQESHNYDLIEFMRAQKMNFYDRVKFLNYARTMTHKCHCFVCGLDDLHSWEALRKHLGQPGHLALPPNREEWDTEE